jgi:hypothetical protein
MQITDREFAEALNQVAKRLMDIGWVDRAAIFKGKMHFGYTPLGLERMETLRSVILGEIDSALNYSQYLALHALLLTHDQRLPDAPEPPQE